MNRRDLLKRLGAAGLIAATIDAPRFWALDRTMTTPRVPTYTYTYTLLFGDGETEQIVVGADAATVERILRPHLGLFRATNLPAGRRLHHRLGWREPA